MNMGKHFFYEYGNQANQRMSNLRPSPPAIPHSQETTVALAGLAALSPAATALSSYQEAAGVADRLLVCLDSAVS